MAPERRRPEVSIAGDHSELSLMISLRPLRASETQRHIWPPVKPLQADDAPIVFVWIYLAMLIAVSPTPSTFSPGSLKNRTPI